MKLSLGHNVLSLAWDVATVIENKYPLIISVEWLKGGTFLHIISSQLLLWTLRTPMLQCNQKWFNLSEELRKGKGGSSTPNGQSRPQPVFFVRTIGNSNSVFSGKEPTHTHTHTRTQKHKRTHTDIDTHKHTHKQQFCKINTLQRFPFPGMSRQPAHLLGHSMAIAICSYVSITRYSGARQQRVKKQFPTSWQLYKCTVAKCWRGRKRRRGEGCVGRAGGR